MYTYCAAARIFRGLRTFVSVVMVAGPCFIMILGFAIAPLRRKFFAALLCAVIVADLCLILGFAIARLRRKFFAARFFYPDFSLQRGFLS